VTGGQSSEAGSTQNGGETVDPGSVDTSGSALIGEPTTGSLAPVASQVVGSVNGAVGSNAVNPAPGTGSVDTTGSLFGEPTTGSLAPVAGSVAGALGSVPGSEEGPALVVGSDGGSGSLGPILLVGGSAAIIGAGIYFAPQIEQALRDAGIVLPPLPALPPLPGF
jgi:hypothetical protein